MVLEQAARTRSGEAVRRLHDAGCGRAARIGQLRERAPDRARLRIR
jgi:hypothetical protein